LHVSTPLQALPSLHASGAPGSQAYVVRLQVSVPLQALPSSHDALLEQHGATGVCVQPVAGVQSSLVQLMPSSHTSGDPGWHPTAATQVSTPLQALPSLHESGVPGTQLCVERSHVSTPLQALPSLQAGSPVQQPLLGVCVHPPSGAQPSTVQPMPSSQFGGLPLWQLPVSGLQLSTPLQGLPSSHAVGVPGRQVCVSS